MDDALILDSIDDPYGDHEHELISDALWRDAHERDNIYTTD